MKLREILGTLPLKMELSEGGTTWTVEALLDSVDDEQDSADYVLGRTPDGRTTIVRLNDEGFRVSPPAFIEIR